MASLVSTFFWEFEGNHDQNAAEPLSGMEGAETFETPSYYYDSQGDSDPDSSGDGTAFMDYVYKALLIYQAVCNVLMNLKA